MSIGQLILLELAMGICVEAGMCTHEVRVLLGTEPDVCS